MTTTNSIATLALRAIAGFALLLVAACGTIQPPPRLFVLSPVAAPPTGDRSGLPTVVVAQTIVPDYLDRPQLVERTSANELKLSDSDQWAEHLSLNVSRVVAQNLSAMVPADATVIVPARSALAFDYQVVVSLNNFELDESRGAILSGRWSVTNSDGTKELAAANVSLVERLAQPGVANAVIAMNQNIGTISHDIAEAIKRLHAAGAGK